MYAVEARSNYKNPNLAPKSYAYYLIHIGQTSKRALYTELSCQVNNANHKITDAFDDQQWYNTYQAGRTYNIKQNIDCYQEEIGRITNVRQFINY